MRLTEEDVSNITDCVTRIFINDPWTLWLFGSRVNDQLKGGDVDLCIIADGAPEELMQKKLWLRPELEEVLDLPVDLVMQSTQRRMKLVTLKAIGTGVLIKNPSSLN